MFERDPHPGSNFPVDRLCSSFARLYEAFDEITGNLPTPARTALFSDTAMSVYRLEGTRGAFLSSAAPHAIAYSPLIAAPIESKFPTVLAFSFFSRNPPEVRRIVPASMSVIWWRMIHRP